MPRKGITAYDLLISCPGDVQEYLDVIRESVDNFNRYFGAINNIEIVSRHWSTDSYPQSGDKPQELINKQFVRDCDAAVAVFWTRFGTPTDKYGSGTEEEIEEMLSVKKQVFMYFLDSPVSPSQVDIEQYNKVLVFKDSYKDKGIYATIKSKDEFRKEFTNHLAMHFLPLFAGESSLNENRSAKPKLLIKNVNGENADSVSIENTHLQNCKLIGDKKEAIKNKILILNCQTLTGRTQKFKVENETELDSSKEIFGKLNLEKLMGSGFTTGTLADADIREEQIKVVEKFAEDNNIVLNEGFWNVGNLKEKVAVLVIAYSSSGTSYEGTDAENGRYGSLNELYWDVVEYTEYLKYFSYIDSQSYVKLTVANVGNSFDEDIDIKLIIKKNSVIKETEISYPGINIIEDLLKIDFTENIFEINSSDTVESYGYYPVIEPVYEDMIPTNPFNRPSASEEYNKYKKKYRKSLEQIFCYRNFENEDGDIFMFHIGYLKHNTTMAFPSILMFKNNPEYIDYEISSKYTPQVVKGKIEITK